MLVGMILTNIFFYIPFHDGAYVTIALCFFLLFFILCIILKIASDLVLV